MPRVRSLAGTGSETEGRPGRSPRKDHPGNKWLCRLRSQPQASNFGRHAADNCLGRKRGDGERRAARGSWYRVRRWSGVAPRLGICLPPALPLRATCSSLGHRRVSLSAKAAPGSTRAARSPLAARWLQLQTLSKIRRGSPHTAGDSVLACSIPGARSLPRCSALGSCGTCSRAVHRVLLRVAAAAQVHDQLSLAPPPRAAPRQSPPPDAPRFPRRARAPPARARAPHPAPWTLFPIAN